MAYYDLEPWGEEAEWTRHGIRSAIAANANRDPKKHPEPYTPDRFMPNTDRMKPEDDADSDRLEAIRQKAREIRDRFQVVQARRATQ